MRRLSFLVNQGENNSFMVHGLEWAAYAEGKSWVATTLAIRQSVKNSFAESERPEFLDFRFPDGSVISLSA
ncbi:MAG: hypothetical protein LBE84_07665 [Planctomycetota bacterium]|jgi:hypothetical protein|nr:hypothetical protein [Planctomycetota bacterium]